MRVRLFQSLSLTVLLAGAGALLALSLRQTGGVLTYTLDDPHIHLALAEQILTGHYGINPGEVASPSSSMLFPLLLALLLAIGLGEAAPLVLALTGQAAAVWLLAAAVAPCLPRPAWALIAAPLMVLAINGFALPLTGMEHPLHIAASLAVVLGLARVARGESAPGWLLAAILLAPALRFEGYALALSATAALALVGQRRAALLALAGLAALTVAYGGTMAALGLPLLPSSVMVKSAVSAAAVEADSRGALVALVVNALRNAMTWQGALLLAGGAALAATAPRALWPVVLPVLAAVAAHLLVGRFGWFGRYEVYALAILLATLALAWRGRPLAMLAALALAAAGYVTVTRQSPAAALGIHEQHRQMHRFSRAFADPVAVNDLGHVAWNNPAPVLDLWGLGSEDARRLTAIQGRTVETLRTLTAGRASYAMIYDIAFVGAIPSEWCRVAALTTSRVIAASDTVSFWLIDRTREAAIREALTAFAPGLPSGARLALFPCED